MFLLWNPVKIQHHRNKKASATAWNERGRPGAPSPHDFVRSGFEIRLDKCIYKLRKLWQITLAQR